MLYLIKCLRIITICGVKLFNHNKPIKKAVKQELAVLTKDSSMNDLKCHITTPDHV